MNNQAFGGSGVQQVTVCGNQSNGFFQFFSKTKRRGQVKRIQGAELILLNERGTTSDHFLVYRHSEIRGPILSKSLQDGSSDGL